MIHLINSENKNQYYDILSQMYKQRATLFIDRLDWNLSTQDGKEIDQFDTDDTIYLVVMDENTGLIRSSIRLNPTKKPHLMSEIFDNLCNDGAPIGEKIFEGSRYCYNPDLLNRNDRLESMRYMMCGVMECAVLHGWEMITFVINMPLLSHCLRCGWDIYPLGIPQYHNKGNIGAFAINVNNESLIAARSNAGLSAPALRIIPAKPIAA